ncbi:probable LRR receptor-like serine/threonine-protein kinase At3g47570 [Ipomoea triloba]|uniref:probable LRR receptor-like serine/threonine-protein kinase At3g47570 n=1 Tax=Ipomoea triloba TaxID=35885 RepID=UPI00125DED62|nr:probable LRR receptor-like serine/threonine-protein kinase At3g47570 [Ipomoea triloba]
MEIRKLSSLLSWLFLAMAFIPIIPCDTATNITTDQSSLLSLKSYTTLSPNHTLANNWSITTSICNWIGVVCGSKHHRVVALDISSMGIMGTLSPQLGNLSFLVSLNISYNSFYGNLPRELANLRRLQYIDFGYNNFSGKIPVELGNLENAKWLILKVNQLDGPIPFTIFNISTLQNLVLNNNSLSSSLPMKLCQHATRLKVFRLHFNKLNGEIPKNLSSCSKLEDLRLSNNNFVRTIPREMGSLNMLRILMLGNNNLEGIIPETIFNISALTYISMENNSLSGILPPNMCSHLQKLEQLYLYTNKLYGNIPRSIGECSNLQYLHMWENQLNGRLPRQIGNLTMLKVLILDKNFLSGKIPRELGNLDKLEIFWSDNNRLSGSVPWEIFNMSTLEKLSLEYNNLSGTLPPSLGYWLSNLKELYLRNNYIGGVIPAQISNASNLAVIEFSQNQFTGFIPNSLGNLAQLNFLSLVENNLTTDPQFSLMISLANCRYIHTIELSTNPLNALLPNAISNLSTTLQYFIIENCNIWGRIPQGIGNLSSLFLLSFWSNDIIGILPTTIQALQSLQLLDISENRLLGSFPNVICELQNLFWISLGKNKFSGPILDCLGNISSLREIYLYENKFTVFPPTLWSLENLLRLDLHFNNLSGSLPQEIGNAKKTILIDLSYNNLSGEIPSSIEGLTEIIKFSVAHNKIHGSIPDTIGKLLDLHSLDLSDNKISGMIPKSLEGLVSLSYFNVSYNRLNGEIPSGGPFANFTFESFLGNDGLCGTSRMHVPPCPANTPRMHQSIKNKLVLIALVSLAVLIVLTASVSVLCIIFKRHSREVPNEPNLLSEISPAKFSYYELQRATNGFDESNLLGSGSFGSVYKGILTNGMHVAVKVFRLIHEGANRSFDSECDILRNIRHRNLTKVLGSCSNLDFKALVLQYMPNGCLHKWLHSHNYFLDMIQRASIMIDVAYALEYLHYDYSNPIIHCDLKPSNVLIDADMVGHLCDFGVAKLLGDGNSIAITNTLATIGYIAPEYGQEGLVSTRSDMYSYGIMLLEVFTKTQPGDEMFSEELSLRSWVHSALPTNIGMIIDPNLLGPDEEKYNEKLQCVSAIFELGMKCSAQSARERMTIKDALPALEKIKVQLLSLYQYSK